MKKLILAVATFGLALAAFGQGAVILDNNNAIGWVDLRTGGNHYTGPFGLELWMKNGNAPDYSINWFNGMWPGSSYPLLAADGFTLQTRISGLTMTWPGTLAGIGEVDMPGVNRSLNNGSAVLGLVIWKGNATTIFGAGNGGILTFVNPTSDYTIPPPNTPVAPGLDGMDQDLIIWIPEPGTFALAGLGAALWLIFRRRS